MAGKVVVIDPGHNGRYSAAFNTQLVDAGSGRRKACNTAGTSTADGYAEHQHNWDVAGRLARLLTLRGARVVLTRSTDQGLGPCVNERAAVGNRATADLVVSIHADGNVAASARGFHVIRATRMLGGPGVERCSARLAQVIRDAFARGTGALLSTYTGGGTGISARSDIAGVALSQVPAVMLEAGNMKNRQDAELLSSPSFRQREAVALLAGIASYQCE